MKKLIKLSVIALLLPLAIYAKAVPVSDFEKVINQKGLVVVELWAPWCGNCKTFKPAYERAKSKLRNKVKFYEINADPVDDPFTKFGIKYGYPAVLLYKDGARVDTQEGGMSEEEMINWIKQYQ